MRLEMCIRDRWWSACRERSTASGCGKEGRMSDSLMAEVVIPFAGQRFDMELALFADVEVLIVECLRCV